MRDPSTLPAFECEAKEVKNALRSFPVATAPGPSGLRVDHLRECLSTPSAVSDALLEALTRFITKALNGDLPGTFAEFFLSAKLLPFRKKDDGVRPIAIGEVLRRQGRRWHFTKFCHKYSKNCLRSNLAWRSPIRWHISPTPFAALTSFAWIIPPPASCKSTYPTP